MEHEVLDCGHAESEHSSITRGFGTMADGTRHCYACCARMDVEAMVKTGRADLYLTEGKEGAEVSNWPGSLKFRARGIRKGRHNIAGTQTTAYFDGPDGATWIARQYGEWNQVARCRRLKTA